MNSWNYPTFDLLNSLTAKVLFKVVLCCTAGFFIPISILLGILALQGIVPANLNDKQYVGVAGFMISMLMAPIFIFLLAIMQWAILVIGLQVVKIALRFVRTDR
jgi:hypothetical protein